MNKLLEAFNIKQRTTYNKISDYNTFQDKDLLDRFRLEILQELSDKGYSNEDITQEIIIKTIDQITLGYNLNNNEKDHLINLIEGEINGYGPLTELLSDNNITEIMVNSPKDIYIEVDGNIIKDEGISFINDEHILRTIEKMIELSNKKIDYNNPIIDTNLVDGSRINAIIPPLTKHPIITIRKFKKEMDDIDTLIGNGTLTPYMARFLKCCIEAKLNILVSGYGNSGKTTLLNILANFIPEEERIITIEDVYELNLSNKHVISLETVPKTNNSNGISTKELIKNSIKMRPDRLIIGEIKSDEALDILEAMNTGNEGSLATIYASSSREAINKLESLIYMSGHDRNLNAIKTYIANSIDIVVHIGKLKDGRKKITNISEICGITNDEINIKDIFAFTQKDLYQTGTSTGEFILYNRIPTCLAKIKNAGITELDDMFKK